jgi:HlyD family secretion protein
MQFRGQVQAKPAAAASGKRKRITRLGLLALGVTAAAYAALAPRSHLQADGLINGDIIPVGPLFRAQITQPLVACHSMVKAGQPLAMVNNFLLEEEYVEGYQAREQALKLERVTQQEGVGMAVKDAEAARQSYQAARINAQKLAAVADSYNELYLAGAIGRVARDSARLDEQQAESAAASLEQAWHRAEINVREVRKDSNVKIDSLGEQLTQVEQTQRRVSTQPLVSPASGQLLDCDARPNQVVDAGTPVFHLFDPDRAYVMAFVDPADAANLAIGDRARIDVPGFAKPLAGHVLAVTLEAGTLPEPLTRYFWQHNQWAQYRPVKIGLDDVKPDVREKLTFGARVGVDIALPSMAHRSKSSWLANIL